MPRSGFGHGTLLLESVSGSTDRMRAAPESRCAAGRLSIALPAPGAPCYAVGRGRSRQRVLLVPHARQRLPGMPPPLLPTTTTAPGAAGSPAPTRSSAPLYVLKQLGTRHMWAGRLVHEAVERALLALRDGHALSEASLIEDTVRQMRQEWKGSRDGVVPGDPEAHRPLRARVRRAHQATASGRPSASTSCAACATSTGCRSSPTSSGRRSSGGSSSRTSAPSRGRARASSRRPTSATGAATIASSSSTGRRAAAARAPSLQLGGYALYALEVLRRGPRRASTCSR